MSENTLSQYDLNNEDKVSSPGNTEKGQQNKLHENVQHDPTATPEDIENANKPQPNVILNKVSGSDSSIAPRRDTERVASRANEAADSTDTNTGGIIAGGAKGASQS